MTEITTVFKGVIISNSFENHIDLKNVSICQFSAFLDITDIVKHVANTFYSDKDWHFRYDVGGMIKLSLVIFFRQVPYKKLVLSKEEAYLLGFKEKKRVIQRTSGGTLHHFVKYRIGVEGTDQIMMMVGKKIARLVDSKDAKLDSTPLVIG